MNATHDHTMGSTIPGTAADSSSQAPAKSSSGIKAFSFAATASQPPGTQGLDVSGWQVLSASDWTNVWNNGGRFVYVKATEGTDYTSSQFGEQYNDSYAAGLAHGAYHFATPNTSSGAAQASFFVAHGGGWTPDGRTLPPLLDIEYNPYGATCYGLSQPAMVSWIADFSSTVQSLTGRAPAIYSTTDWWTQCTGNTSQFSANPLFIARYPSNIASGAGTLPNGWTNYTFWQYADSGVFPGDQDVFNGSTTDLANLAFGAGSFVKTATSDTIYLVSGTTKYPVPSPAIYDLLSPLGRYLTVSQSYLDSLTTGPSASAVIRDGTTGDIYLVDQGSRHHFSSCAQLTQFGYTCDSLVNLQPTQVAQFPLGGPMTSFYQNPGDACVYYISGTMTANPVCQWGEAVALNGGSSPFVAVMRPSVIAQYKLGNTILQPLTMVKTASSPDIYLVDGSAAKIHVTSMDMASNYGGSSSYATLPANAFAGYSTENGSPGSFFACAGSGQAYFAANGSKYAVTSAATSGSTVSALSADTCSRMPLAGSFAGQVYLSAPGYSNVYEMKSGSVRAVPDWSTFVALGNGTAPSIAPVIGSLSGMYPIGAPYLSVRSLVRTASDSSVYLVDGTTALVHIASFTTPGEMGISGWSTVADASVATMTKRSGDLTRVVTCGSTNYFAAGGTLYPLASPNPTGIAATTLSAATCRLLSLQTGTPLKAVFVKDPSSASVYYVVGGQRRPVSSWSTLTGLAQSSNPTILTTYSGGTADLPLGATY